MEAEPVPEAVPSYFLIKLQKDDRYHYIFAELVASCNYSTSVANADSAGEAQPLFDRKVLDDLIASRAKFMGDTNIFAEATVVLPNPGDANDPWTHAAVRMQSKAQSAPKGS